VHDFVGPSHIAYHAEGFGVITFQLNKNGLAKEVSAEEHAVADFVLVEVPRQVGVGEWGIFFHA
jgi:hypothetical protein